MKIGFDQTPELNVRETMVVCGSGTSEASIGGGFMIVHPRIRQLWREMVRDCPDCRKWGRA